MFFFCVHEIPYISWNISESKLKEDRENTMKY